MNPRDDETWRAYERLADALAREVLRTDEGEILGAHAGRGARVRADALRQAVRRGLAGQAAEDDVPRDLVHALTMRPQRLHKP